MYNMFLYGEPTYGNSVILCITGLIVIALIWRKVKTQDRLEINITYLDRNPYLLLN